MDRCKQNNPLPIFSYPCHGSFWTAGGACYGCQLPGWNDLYPPGDQGERRGGENPILRYVLTSNMCIFPYHHQSWNCIDYLHFFFQFEKWKKKSPYCLVCSFYIISEDDNFFYMFLGQMCFSFCKLLIHLSLWLDNVWVLFTWWDPIIKRISLNITNSINQG